MPIVIVIQISYQITFTYCKAASKVELRNDASTKAKLQARGEDFVNIEEAKALIHRHANVVAVVENSAIDRINVSVITVIRRKLRVF